MPLTPAQQMAAHTNLDFFFAWLGTAPQPEWAEDGGYNDAMHEANLDDHLLAYVGGGPL